MSSSARTPQITVFGSLNIDLVSYVSHHPLPGETMTSSSFAVSPGGKGANQAVACAKLSRARDDAAPSGPNESAHIRMVGAVGADTYGEVLKSNMASHGVDVAGVTVPAGAKTGIAIIVVDEPTGQNRIILSPEANHSLQPEQFENKAAAGSAGPGLPWVVEPCPDLLIMQLEIPIPTVLAALRAARAADVDVLLNPAPAVPLPNEAYAGLAHLVVNETEAAILGGVADAAELDTEAGLRRVGDLFLAKGVRTVIITLGGRGVYFLDARTRAAGLVPAEKVSAVVDTTAAGDTFVGAYALAATAARVACQEFDVEAAVRRANRAAARTVERMGAQTSIPWRDELTE
jgi:ribokinase